MQNRDRGYIYGISAGMQLDLARRFSFKGIVNYTYGRYYNAKSETETPLDHIPPLFGQAGLLFRERSMDAEFFVRFNDAKRTTDYSPSGEDNASYSADPKNGYMPAWYTLNLRTGFTLARRFRVNVACENLLDRRYRVFASGINAPGRNFILSLRYKL
jgi:hemoglobin/transferrin/lactoferrin receptor protein